MKLTFGFNRLSLAIQTSFCNTDETEDDALDSGSLDKLGGFDLQAVLELFGQSDEVATLVISVEVPFSFGEFTDTLGASSHQYSR